MKIEIKIQGMKSFTWNTDFIPRKGDIISIAIGDKYIHCEVINTEFILAESTARKLISELIIINCEKV